MRRIAIALFAISVVLAALAPSAGAYPRYEYTSSIGGPGNELGQFDEPAGMAVSSEGKLFVADTQNGRVEIFSSSGEYLDQITKGIFSLGKPSDVALDASGNLWVVDRANERVVEFKQNGEFIREFGEFGSGNGQFWFPNNIAVDSSGNLWVTDTANDRVEEFTSAGKYIRQFGKAGTGNGQFTYPQGIAIDKAGHVWVLDAQGEHARLEEFSSEGAYMTQVGSSALVDPLGDALSIAPDGTFWIADRNGNHVVVLNEKGELLTTFGGFEEEEEHLIGPAGIAFAADGNPWVADAGLSKVEKWLALPEATTGSATAVASSSATLNGSINPRGTATTYQFEYGLTAGYGTKSPVTPKSIGAGSTSVPVSVSVSELKPSTLYHFRVVARSAAGETVGKDQTFTTPSALSGLPLLDTLTRTENPLSNGGKWSPLAWDTSTTGHNTGRDTTTGWSPVDAYPAINGAYWNSTTFTDKTGEAAELYVQAGPNNANRYVGLWLDMETPGTVKSGYQLRWIENSELSTYTLKLVKWTSGTEAVLASSAAVSVPTGTVMAIVDSGGTVEAWKGTSGGSFTLLLTAKDTTYSSGYAGIEGTGNLSLSSAFRAGSL